MAKFIFLAYRLSNWARDELHPMGLADVFLGLLERDAIEKSSSLFQQLLIVHPNNYLIRSDNLES